MATDYYNVLQINPKAAEHYVKKSYRRLALIWHPDNNSSCKKLEAEGTFNKISQAHEVLTDSQKCHVYDKEASLKYGRETDCIFKEEMAAFRLWIDELEKKILRMLEDIRICLINKRRISVGRKERKRWRNKEIERETEGQKTKRQKQKYRETKRQRQRRRETKRQRQRDKETKRRRQRDKERKKQRQKQRQRDRKKEAETERQKKKEAETERQKKKSQRQRQRPREVVDYYELLAVKRDATDDDLKKAYRRLLLKWHPDKNPSSKKVEAETMFRKIYNAYQVLTDPYKRIIYTHYGEDALKNGLKNVAALDAIRIWCDELEKKILGMHEDIRIRRGEHEEQIRQMREDHVWQKKIEEDAQERNRQLTLEAEEKMRKLNLETKCLEKQLNDSHEIKRQLHCDGAGLALAIIWRRTMFNQGQKTLNNYLQ